MLCYFMLCAFVTYFIKLLLLLLLRQCPARKIWEELRNIDLQISPTVTQAEKKHKDQRPEKVVSPPSAYQEKEWDDWNPTSLRSSLLTIDEIIEQREENYENLVEQ